MNSRHQAAALSPSDRQASLSGMLQKLRSIVGPDAVSDEPRLLAEIANCTSGVRRSILGVVFPRERDQVISIVELAAGHGIPLYPVSTGRNWGYGTSVPPVDGCLVVNLSRMNRIVEPPDPVTGLVTLEPGVTQGDLWKHLREHDLPFMVPTTGAGPTASIVGNALERGHGLTPVADHFAAVTSLEAVLPDGSLYRSPLDAMGVSRGVGFKWGIGPYVDGLFSQGSFGIVTKMTLALARRPDSVKVFVFGLKRGKTLEEATSAVQRVLATLPGVVGGINVMNAHRVLALSVPYPLDQLAPNGIIPSPVLAKLMSGSRIKPWTIFGTLYGARRVVAAAQTEIKRIVSPLASGLMFVSPEMADTLQRYFGSAPLLRERVGGKLAALKASLALVGGQPNQAALPLAYWRFGRQIDRSAPLDPARDGCGLIWYAPLVEMKPESVRRFAKMIETIMPRHGFEPVLTFISVSERCFLATVPVLFAAGVKEQQDAARRCHMELLDEGANQGYLPYRVDVGSLSWLMTRAPEHWRLVSRLKRAIDPNAIISPGRYVSAE